MFPWCSVWLYIASSPLSSMVGFSSKQRHMGTSARNQLVMNPKNTIWGYKCLVGRKFSDPIVQEAIKGFPYEVVQQPGDEIGIKVGSTSACVLL